jgi:transcriptional regulator with XRE-family HTH domain
LTTGLALAIVINMKAKSDIEKQLRTAMLSGPMSMYRLAKISGISKGVISRFVNHHRGLALTTAAKLAAVLGLELRPMQRPKGKKAVQHGKRLRRR